MIRETRGVAFRANDIHTAGSVFASARQYLFQWLRMTEQRRVLWAGNGSVSGQDE